MAQADLAAIGGGQHDIGAVQSGEQRPGLSSARSGWALSTPLSLSEGLEMIVADA